VKQWVYGITTVPSRLNTTLPITLETLKNAGFDKPRLFIDGVSSPEEYQRLNLETTCRYPAVRTAGNWYLSLAELYYRNPTADLFALFQDDIVICKNARQYLETLPYGRRSNDHVYWNLHSFPANEEIWQEGSNPQNGVRPKDHVSGYYDSNQLGKGALALVFDRPAVVKVLGSEYLAIRPQDLNKGHQGIDGAIVTALNNVGYKEQVHYPCLVQHIGKISTMGHGSYPLSTSFVGESFDAMRLVCSETESQTHSIELVSLNNLSPVG